MFIVLSVLHKVYLSNNQRDPKDNKLDQALESYRPVEQKRVCLQIDILLSLTH